MTHTPDTTDAPTNPFTRIPVDRVQAAVKAVWRLLSAGLLTGTAVLIGFQLGDLHLFWQTQPITLIAIGVFVCALAITGVLIGIGGLRWLLLACWPGRLFIEIDAASIRAAFGPFGGRTFPWASLRCEIAEGFDAEMLSHVADDAFTPVLNDTREPCEVYGWIQSHSGADPDVLTRALRPYLIARMGDA